MITIKLGGELINLTGETPLQTVLLQKGYTQSYFAVAINNQFIPRQDYDNIQLKHLDNVEIIMPMQGG